MKDRYSKNPEKPVVPFTASEKPAKPRFFMKLFIWSQSLLPLLLRRHRFEKIGMDDLDHPYLLLSNHNSYMDYKTATKAVFPRSASNVVALDAFSKRKHLLRWIGGIGKRRFVSDTLLVRHIIHVIRNLKLTMILYPEAKHALIGTPSKLPANLGKLAKVAGVPVVTLIAHGHHLSMPYWHKKKRFIRTEATLRQIITAEEIKSLDAAAIQKRITDAFSYDDYQWQKDRGLKIRKKDRAEGLHRVLYRCPACESESSMTSKGVTLRCEACGLTHRMLEDGSLEAGHEKTRFSHIPHWFDWQKEEVRRAIESATYHVETEALLDLLPSAEGFIDAGRARFTHDENGLALTYHRGDLPEIVFKESKSQYTLHVDFDHNGKGDCLSFSTDTQTYYIYPLDQGVPVVKVMFAVEILHDRFRPVKNRLK